MRRKARLKTADGVALVKKLAAKSDVIMQNFRPGVVDRMGIGEAAIRAVAPDIIRIMLQ